VPCKRFSPWYLIWGLVLDREMEHLQTESLLHGSKDMRRILCVAICLVAGLCFAQPGFAWQNVNQGCLATGCHVEGAIGAATPPQLHGITAHTSNCANCHAGGAVQKGNVETSKCTVCHPIGNKGLFPLCPLINVTPHAGVKNTCLGCHPFCALANTITTTTAASATTTTTTDSETTTTIQPSGCLTIEPSSVTVNGKDNVTKDVVVTFERADLVNAGLTKEDLAKLEISFSDQCFPYITVNTTNYAIADNKATATVNTNVAGDAPSVECTLTVSDPQGIVTPPLNCEAAFTITSTAEPCKIISIKPSSIRVGLGLIPRIRRVTVTLNADLEAAGITTGDLNFENTPKGVTILSAQISFNSISALILFSGVKPGTYNVNLGPCGSIPLIISRF
jgi:hypothetical protein